MARELKLNSLKTKGELKGEAKLCIPAEVNPVPEFQEATDTYSTLGGMLRPKEDFGGPKSERLKSGIGQIPPSAIRAIGAVFVEGEGTYGRDNWKRGAGNFEYQAERLEHAESHFLEFKDMFIDGNFLKKEYPKVIKRQLLAKVAWFCVTQIELMRLETIAENEEFAAAEEVANYHQRRAEEQQEMADKAREYKSQLRRNGD